MLNYRRLLTVLLLIGLPARASDAEDLTLANVTAPAPNMADEPVAETYSLDAAAHFLDQAALDWTQSRQCFTCHTNYAYLRARPVVSADNTAHQQVRAALEDLVQVRWPQAGPRWDAEVVMSAAVLAFNDAATTGALHPATRTALDRMWTVQREDGGVDWIKCGWPPMESDDDFGASMIALAVGAAPDDYRQTEAAQAGLARLRAYVAAHPAPTLHHRAMLLWADSYKLDLLTDEDRQSTVADVLSLQNNDGGWALGALGDWQRSDGQEQDRETSDGYGTGFVIYVLRRSGIAADDERLQRGIAWLKSSQRASGRWYTRSLNKDSQHFISHAGTAFAVMAIAACEE
jgi:squalene-hopene/tetraprenyl-beta-curcumene cyclase